GGEQEPQEQHAQDAEIVSGASSAAGSGEAPEGTRARRYTPKQRGRAREQRAEYAATVPDLRPAFAGINHTERGQGQPPSLVPGAGEQPLQLSQLTPDAAGRF